MSSITELDTAEGHALARAILRPQLPYDPHDYQILGICKAVDGNNVLGIIPTGGGKTGFIGLYMKLLLAMRSDDRIHLERRASLPEKPVMVVVVPTKGLGQQMVRRSCPRVLHPVVDMI
jgi:superfamily II DNA or RNA helicase